MRIPRPLLAVALGLTSCGIACGSDSEAPPLVEPDASVRADAGSAADADASPDSAAPPCSKNPLASERTFAGREVEQPTALRGIAITPPGVWWLAMRYGDDLWGVSRSDDRGATW